MPDYSTFSPVPRGVANTGDAVVYGEGLGALHYLQHTDALRARQRERAQAAALKQKDTEQNSVLAKAKFNTDGGVHYLPMMNDKRQQLYREIETIATDQSKPRVERQLAVQQKVDNWNAELAAGKANDAYLDSELKRYQQDKRINTAAAGELLLDSLYEHQADGSLALDEQGNRKLVPALAWDRQAAAEAFGKGNAHINTPELFQEFVDKLPEDSITYSQQPLPGGRGYKRVAKSNVFELNDDGTIKRDLKTGQRVLKNSPEMLAAFLSDPLQKQWLAAENAKHEAQLTGIVQKMQANEPLTEDERHIVATEQTADGRSLELVKRALAQYGYGRQEIGLLAKATPKAATAKTPKFSRVGGTSYAPELVGGTAVGGTSGLLALASSDPLGRVKADGSVQPHTARAVHKNYILLQNGQPARLVTNNAEPQNLAYTKPQLYLTSPTGNVVTPTDPSLLQRYQAGDQQPLLNWARAQREAHPGYAVKWHFQAVPTDGKLTGQNNAEQIYQRLVADRTSAHLTPGTPGYKSDDELRSTAQKMASQQGATLLVPYTGEDKRSIDLATGYLLRDPKQQRQMQAQYDYFNTQTTPRSAEQRPAAKKLGIDFGAKPAAAAPTTPASSAPTFKRAGTKKTGIKF